MVTVEQLEAFGEAWNSHDVDLIMSFMAEECVFEAAMGAEASGKRHVGRAQVRAAFAGIFQLFPDARFRNFRHVVAGDRGVSEWLFTANGGKIEVNGCDLFTFAGEKIAVKNSYLKNRVE